MLERETFSILQNEVGREKTRRVHQIEETHYTFDCNVNCPDDVEMHVVRLHFTCKLPEFVQHLKCLRKPQIL